MRKIKKAITVTLASAIMTTMSITSFTSLAFADELSPETCISTEADQQTVDSAADTELIVSEENNSCDSVNPSGSETAEADLSDSETTAEPENSTETDTSLTTAEADNAPESENTEADDTVNKSAETTENTEEAKCVPYANEKGQTVYTGKYATAYVAGNGRSGYLEITDTSIWDTKDGLTEIGGYPLSQIIRFGNTGFISNIYIAMNDGGWIYNNRIFATGQDSDMEGDYRSYIHFTDETNDTYDLMIDSESLKTHHVDYNSENPRLKKISWYTDDYESPKEILYDFDSVKDWPVPAYGTFYEKEGGWKIYKDEYATAIVPPAYKDATSFARIRITDTSIWKNGNELTNINGVSLKDITSQGSGYISSVKTVHDGGIIYDNTLTVKGGKESLWSKYDYQTYFTDATGDEYSLLILDSGEKNHRVWYNSDHPEIVEFRWEIYYS